MKVYYMNGAGNDFMVFDGRGLDPDYSALAKKLCALRHADGLMAIGTSETADFEMIFYNSDGTRGEMCGNGARCISRLAHDLGIAGEHMVFDTMAGPVEGWRIDENQYRVALNPPTILDLNRKGDVAYVELGNPGSPHAVRLHEGDVLHSKEALRSEMQALRHDPAFPKGANVSYCHLLGPAEADILTFERGVEDFTLACGTGSGSTACVLWKKGLLPGKKLTAHVPGGTLVLTIEGTDQVDKLYLEGPTQIVETMDIAL